MWMRSRWWVPWVVMGLGCQPPLILEGESESMAESTDGSSPLTTTGAPPDPSTSTTPTTDSVDPPTGDDTTAGPPPIPEDCDVLEQDCPEGYKCTYFDDAGMQWGHYSRCMPVVDDPQGPGESCSVTVWPPDGNDTCDGTSFCWWIDQETLMGTCIAFCIGTYDDLHCADPCAGCAVAGDGIVLPCFVNCDPLTESCPPGQGCYPVNESFICEPDASEGAGVGDQCEYINGCSSGLVCISSELMPDCQGAPAGCCSPICDPAAAFDLCPELLPGTQCEPWYEPGQHPLPRCGYDPPGVCTVLP